MRRGTIKDSNTLTVILPAEPLPLPVEPAPPLVPPSIWSRRPMSCCSEIFCRTCPDCAMRMSKSCTAVALDGFTRAIRETTNDFSLLHSTLEIHTSLTGIRIKDRAECLSLHLVLCLCFLSLLWLIVSRRRRSSWHGFRRTIASCSPSLLHFTDPSPPTETQVSHENWNNEDIPKLHWGRRRGTCDCPKHLPSES